MSKKLFSPIAIDLGGKHTGVYMAHYPEHTKLENVANKRACTLTVDNKITLMMADRTARRHQRRNYARRKMAKRLAMLVFENAFKLDTVKHREVISFLLNRRGRILDDEGDINLLNSVPAEIFFFCKRDRSKCR